MFNRTHCRRIVSVVLAAGALGSTGLVAGASPASAFTPPQGETPTTNVIIYTLTPTERTAVCGSSRSTTIKYIEPYGTYTVSCSNGDVDFQSR